MNKIINSVKNENTYQHFFSGFCRYNENLVTEPHKLHQWWNQQSLMCSSCAYLHVLDCWTDKKNSKNHRRLSKFVIERKRSKGGAYRTLKKAS